jgi:hypothetical protein
MRPRFAARGLLALLALVVLSATLGASAALADPLDVIGAADPGTPGYNAMAVGLDGFAYLGSWGSVSHCPGLGARIFDIHDPTSPVLIGAAAAYPGTTAEHLAAVRYATSSFAGNILFAGIQRCNGATGSPSGLAIWDISDPSNPTELAFFSVARGSVRGVHEFTLGQRGDRWYAYLAVPNSETINGLGDLRVLDVTDPRNPVQVTDWGARKDAGLPVGARGDCAPACRGKVPQAFLHSVALSSDGLTAYLSYWDQGVILLDVSEPNAPRWIGRFMEPLAAEGNTHSVALAHGGLLALVADETIDPPWGRLRLVDIQDPTNPLQVGSFDTPNSAAGTPGDDYAYTIHNPLADDRNPNRAYLAWYADGVRLLDISDASHPVELTSWVPPRGGMIWSVSALGELLLAGDINNGLYILRR